MLDRTPWNDTFRQISVALPPRSVGKVERMRPYWAGVDLGGLVYYRVRGLGKRRNDHS